VEIATASSGYCSFPAYPFIEMVASLFAIDLPGNQPGAIGLPAKPLAPVSPWSARKNQRPADLGKLSAICVFMRFCEIAHHLLAA
jgi:hypothetical protein